MLPLSSLPASPPVGTGITTIVVPAAGVGAMNAVKSTSLAIALAENETLVITVSTAPDSPANYANISIRGAT